MAGLRVRRRKHCPVRIWRPSPESSANTLLQRLASTVACLLPWWSRTFAVEADLRKRPFRGLRHSAGEWSAVSSSRKNRRNPQEQVRVTFLQTRRPCRGRHSHGQSGNRRQRREQEAGSQSQRSRKLAVAGTQTGTGRWRVQTDCHHKHGEGTMCWPYQKVPF